MSTKQTEMWGLVRLMKGQQGLLALTLLAGIVAQSGTLASIALAAWLTGCAIVTPSVSGLIPIIGWMLGLVLLTAAARWLQSWSSHDLAFALIEKLQIGIFDGLERAAPGRLLGQRVGDLASIATHDAELMERFYAHTLADYVGAVIVPLAALAVLYGIHPQLALVVSPFLLLIASVPLWLSRLAAHQGKQVMSQFGQLNADTVEFIAGQRELAVFGQSENVVQRLVRDTQNLSKAQCRYGSRSGLEQAAIDLLSASTLVATVLSAGHLLAQGQLETLMLPVVLVLSVGALLPIVDVTQTASQWGELRAGAARILTIMQQSAQVRDEGKASAPVEKSLRVEQVSFAYDRHQKAVLDKLSFEVKSGEIVALSGASGAGKSTLTHLLLRFWDPDSGAIFIGDRDIRTLPLATLRQLVCWVPQDVYLFAGTIEENIRLGCPQASQAQVVEAARLAQADAFIRTLPQGYKSQCGEGGKQLSGGQRQRIAIARALLTEAPILILDEASSSLDNPNELAFQRALESLRHQRTILLIAHRPATLRRADRVVKMENSRAS
ncbi:ABC transporter ATP-binding protein [Ewingella sp. AOP9-I1-14]